MPAIACKDENGNPTGKWKWGHRGQCIYNSQREAEKAGIAIMIDSINKAKERLNKVVSNHK